MLNTFSYGSNFFQLPKRDNLHIKDKKPAPNLSVIRKFYCIYESGDSRFEYWQGRFFLPKRVLIAFF